MNALALVFVAVLSALPALAGEGATARQKLLVERDPVYARAFLSEDARQRAAKAEDPKEFPGLFQTAVELKDVYDILHGQLEVGSLRQALELCRSVLCSRPQLLMDWRAKYMSYVDEKRVSEAVADWSTLPLRQRAFVQGRGTDEAKWKTLTLGERKALIEAWGRWRLAEFMKASPKTPKELEAMRVEANAIHSALDHNDAVRLWDRYRQADAAVDALVDAQKRVDKTADPKLKAMLDKARAGGDLEGTLADLNKVFDGLKVENKALKAAAPAAQSQGFDAGQTALLATMLKKGLMKEVEGTWAGEELIPFYKRKELKLVIRPLGVGRIGEYHDSSEEMVFNQAFIEEYVKANGLTPAQLLSSAAALDSLTVQLSPLFVHEAYHQLQDDFCERNRLPNPVAQHRELESMQVEALYILQKMKHDAGFKKIMEGAQEGSKLARESLSKAQRLEKGAGWMRDTIVSWHYPGLRSLEGWASTEVSSDRYYLGRVRAELDRRAKLPIWSRFPLAGRKPFSSTHLTVEQWNKELPTVGTETLESLKASYEADLAKMPQAYDALGDRLEGYNKSVEAKLKLLKAGGGAPPPKKAAVPSPAGTK